MNFINRLIYHWHYPKLNILKTLLVNFKTLPLKTAIKFPIYIYGKLDIYHLMGNIEIQTTSIKRGMIKMGANKEFLNPIKGRSLLILSSQSKIIFTGTCEISSNFLIRTGFKAELKFGKDVFLGSQVKVVCIHKIKIGSGSRIGFESQLIDSDFHFVYDLTSKKVNPREKEINIGEFNWIGNRCTISKGCTTDKLTIVASSSTLNRDYYEPNIKYALLAGTPAKMVKSNIRRIFDITIEEQLINFYKENTHNTKIPEELLKKIEMHLMHNSDKQGGILQ